MCLCSGFALDRRSRASPNDPYDTYKRQSGTSSSGRVSAVPSCGSGNTNYNFYLVFDRFPAELGPETPSNVSGSKNGAERTQNQPRRPMLRPFRDHFPVRHIVKWPSVGGPQLWL